MENSAPPRVRLSKHIDLGMANKDCLYCNGSGIVGYKKADLDDGQGEQAIPIICRCVSRNGGVKEDQLDRILAEAQTQMASGVFHESLAADIRRIPKGSRERAVAALMRDMVNEEKSATTKQAVDMTLQVLERDADWGETLAEAMRILIKDANDPLADERIKTLATSALADVRNKMN